MTRSLSFQVLSGFVIVASLLTVLLIANNGYAMNVVRSQIADANRLLLTSNATDLENRFAEINANVPFYFPGPRHSNVQLPPGGNLLYSDKTLLNLIDWGIEGRHYTKISDDIIGFPHGISAANVGYSAQGDQWIFGNQFNSYLFKTEDPHKWETYRAYNEQAVLSKSLGFTFDPTSVQNEIAACNTVLTQYAIGLNSGGLDPDKYVPELNKKLKAAGIDTIIAEKQRQVDAWAAAG